MGTKAPPAAFLLLCFPPWPRQGCSRSPVALAPPGQLWGPVGTPVLGGDAALRLAAPPPFCSVQGDPMGGRAGVTPSPLAPAHGGFPSLPFFSRLRKHPAPHTAQGRGDASSHRRGQGTTRGRAPRDPCPFTALGASHPPLPGTPAPAPPDLRETPASASPGLRGDGRGGMAGGVTGQEGGTGRGQRAGQPLGLCPGLRAAGW